MSQIKELTTNERESLRQEFESKLHDFISIIIHKKLEIPKPKETLQKPEETLVTSVETVVETLTDSNDSVKPAENVETSPKIIDNTNKIKLPPAEIWQGPSKEAFKNLTKLHKNNKNNLSMENKKWTLEKKDFKSTDRKVWIESEEEKESTKVN